MKDYYEAIKDAIRHHHHCEGEPESVVAVKEVFRGKTVWDGEVVTVRLIGHPKAKNCFAWGYEDKGEWAVTTVLEIPPIVSPQTAVRAAIASFSKDYSQKVQDVLAPPMQPPPGAPVRFIFTTQLPLEVTSGGVLYRLEIDRESVSRSWRVFARNLNSGTYRAWLVLTTTTEEKLTDQIYKAGIELTPKMGCYAIFQDLVKAGKASVVQ